MKPSNLVSIQSIRQLMLACFFALAIYGCSGSSDSGTGEIENGSESTLDTVNGGTAIPNEDSNIAGMDVGSGLPVPGEESESTDSGEPPDVAQPIPDVAKPTPVVTEPSPIPDVAQPIPVVAQPTPVVTEPSSPATTRVDFDITVPIYMSNELQVQLLWGDIGINANWQVAQSWTATLDLPTNSENLLVVNFADRNGAIVLGTYEQQLTTTYNARDSYLIEADQFDTVRWDGDGDGVSNLTELLAGNDPLLDESLSLEIRDSLNSDGQHAMVLIGTYSQRFERSIPDERPYFDDQEVVVPRPDSWPESVLFAERTQLTIDIDASGNGTYYNRRQVWPVPIDFTILIQEGTRTRTDSSVHWTGLYRSFSAGASCNLDNVTFTIETYRLDDGVIRQESEQNHNANCSLSNDRVGIAYAVTGVTIGESEFCNAIAGTIRLQRNNDLQVSVISKTSDATHWNVNVSDDNGQFVEEYLVPAIDLEFYCEHADL